MQTILYLMKQRRNKCKYTLTLAITYNNVKLHIQQNSVDILTFTFGNVDP